MELGRVFGGATMKLAQISKPVNTNKSTVMTPFEESLYQKDDMSINFFFIA